MDINKNPEKDIELRHLRYFVAVAEELHFGRAALKLGIAQPPLSQQIQKLEAMLGVKLFERTSRQVALTDAGAVFLEGAQRTLAQAKLAFDEARTAGRGQRGSVRVAFAASVMFSSLPEYIREFREAYPAAELELQEMSTGPQVTSLYSGDIDIGFGRQPTYDSSITSTVLTAEPLEIALNEAHPLAHKSDLSLSDLAHEDFVLFPEEVAPGLYSQVFSVCREAGFKPHVIQESRELYTTVSLVEAGVGVTIVPASVRKMGWGGVVYRDISSPLAQSAIEMLWRVNERSPVVLAFLNLVLGKLNPADPDRYPTLN